MTNRNLHSHDVAAPMSPQNQEVSCYIDYDISAPEQSLWQVQMVNAAADGDSSWLAIRSHVRLIHVNTSQVLKTSGRQLEDWGYRQLEVVADRLRNQLSTVWNVEEHRYTQSNDRVRREQEINDNVNAAVKDGVPLDFLGKFWELQLKMLTMQPNAIAEHTYSSDALQWPLMMRNIVYWVDPQTNKQIHLLGNPVSWFAASIAAIAVYPALVLFYILRRRRACFDLTEDVWQQFVNVGKVLYIGYLFHYVPYLLMERTLFLYHYLPALLFSLMLLAAVTEHIGIVIRSRWPSLSVLYLLTVGSWLIAVTIAFVHFGSVSYGRVPISTQQASSLRWLDSWDFIVR
jgi:dolichyl-phosphate-mannose-protein mannosyltransferase